MGNGLESGVQALGASQKRMEYIAVNLANLQAPGYKRLNAFTHVIESVRQGRKSSAIETQSEVDFSQGQINPTGNPLDVALDGEGFLALETPTGEAYTRNGRFHLDAQGALLNEDGFAVAWEGGQGRFQPVGLEITVDATGAVRQGPNDIGRLKLVDFADRTQLQLDAKGHFRATRGARPVTATAEVRGGALERSNTESIDELVSMIRVQRSFESATSVIKSIDQSYKRLNAPR
jgi:flagellar basal body rod protein FlgG